VPKNLPSFIPKVFFINLRLGALKPASSRVTSPKSVRLFSDQLSRVYDLTFMMRLAVEDAGGSRTDDMSPNSKAVLWRLHTATRSPKRERRVFPSSLTISSTTTPSQKFFCGRFDKSVAYAKVMALGVR
jgi:hypothetical protein